MIHDVDEFVDFFKPRLYIFVLEFFILQAVSLTPRTASMRPAGEIYPS